MKNWQRIRVVLATLMVLILMPLSAEAGKVRPLNKTLAQLEVGYPYDQLVLKVVMKNAYMSGKAYYEGDAYLKLYKKGKLVDTMKLNTYDPIFEFPDEPGFSGENTTHHKFLWREDPTLRKFKLYFDPPAQRAVDGLTVLHLQMEYIPSGQSEVELFDRELDIYQNSISLPQ